ncbi:bile acid-CoA:amino acid N-acyltransferase-like [Lissotriton helveticus]
MVYLSVMPRVSLTDEPVKIRVSDVEPNRLVTIRASLVDEKGFFFHSRAFYHADAAGEIDLEQAEATGGSFQGRLPMGLFWALRPEKPFLRLAKRDAFGSPFKITLDVFDSLQLVSNPDVTPVASQTVERWYVAPGVQRIQIREGRVRGTLFLPPGEGPFPGVIDLFGGTGGLTEFRSSLLASRGFAALTVAYFAYDDLPSFLVELDLEYFEEAVKILLRHPKVLGPKVGVISVCKGAEIGLSMASYLKQVTATVSINGPNFIHGNSLRYKDICIPGSPYRAESLCLNESGTITFSDMIGDSQENEKSLIPVERAQGHILFVVGGKDANFNSKGFANEMLARMRKHKNMRGQLLLYPDAGHLIEPPGSPFCPMSINPFFPLPLMWGGELAAHGMAQDHAWQEVQRFLRTHLELANASVSRL